MEEQGEGAQRNKTHKQIYLGDYFSNYYFFSFILFLIFSFPLPLVATVLTTILLSLSNSGKRFPRKYKFQFCTFGWASFSIRHGLSHLFAYGSEARWLQPPHAGAVPARRLLQPAP